MLEDLMSQSRPRQLTYTRNLLAKKFPAHHQDFTRAFPRVLSLYIFSFLDPRSLCRCAQACWYWKFLTESDQIWMPKCLRFGWTPKQSPTASESNVWKRVYSFNIQALQTMPIRVRAVQSADHEEGTVLSGVLSAFSIGLLRRALVLSSGHRSFDVVPSRSFVTVDTASSRTSAVEGEQVRERSSPSLDCDFSLSLVEIQVTHFDTITWRTMIWFSTP